MKPRKEFPSKVKRDALDRSGGVCECHRLAAAGVPGFDPKGCGVLLRAGGVYFEHVIPDGAGGKPTLDNCAAVTKTCGNLKAHAYDQGKVAETRHKRDAIWGLKKRKGPPIPGSRDSGLKRTFYDGTVRR